MKVLRSGLLRKSDNKTLLLDSTLGVSGAIKWRKHRSQGPDKSQVLT
jgi:hypothetical protein